MSIKSTLTLMVITLKSDLRKTTTLMGTMIRIRSMSLMSQVAIRIIKVKTDKKSKAKIKICSKINPVKRVPETKK